MTIRRIALIATAAVTIPLAGVGTATAAGMIGLLPGHTPTVTWSQVDQDYRTYSVDCGPIIINGTGYETSPRYAAWIDSLRSRGWHGIAGDTMEALYPKGC